MTNINGGKESPILSLTDLIPENRDAENPVPFIEKVKDSDDASIQGNESVSTRERLKSTLLITSLILILGAATSAAFLGVGITSANQDQFDQFDNQAQDLVNRIERAWEDYVTAASWIHGRCRSRSFSRKDFRETYEYLINSGLDFQAAQFDPNITHAERPAAEEEARAFYAENYPQIDYRGFVGFNYDNSTMLDPRNESDFYFPIHYMEPVLGNERAIDLDYHASGSRKRTVLSCMENGTPALTDRLTLVQEKTESAFGVVLMHPGYNLTTEDDVWPKDLASIVIRIPDLLRRAAVDQGQSSAVYIYETSASGGLPVFLGGVEIIAEGEGTPVLNFLPELELEELKRTIDAPYYHEETIQAANKEWIVAVHSLEGTYEADLLFVILGGCIIFVASGCLAYWVYSNSKRTEQFGKLRAVADREKASLILDNARQATKAERELNDFIAHEVRNPVAAAMSACSFVKTAVNAKVPLDTEDARKEAREDVNIIDNALRFVNDLLRNMLDMHRASNKQLKVNMTPTDILHDVLEPVQAMLPQRDSKFQVLVECQEGLVTMTDRLRLKQVCLNLGRNSVKFIDEGFIRLKAEVIEGETHIVIEDSGPGIPKQKRELLFSKFQESLDSLSQGTVSERFENGSFDKTSCSI
jgi:signal transduction histidine kinase